MMITFNLVTDVEDKACRTKGGLEISGCVTYVEHTVLRHEYFLVCKFFQELMIRRVANARVRIISVTRNGNISGSVKNPAAFLL